LSQRYAALLLNKPRPQTRMTIHVVMLLLEDYEMMGWYMI
jgi:hypothetical protein